MTLQKTVRAHLPWSNLYICVPLRRKLYIHAVYLTILSVVFELPVIGMIGRVEGWLVHFNDGFSLQGICRRHVSRFASIHLFGPRVKVQLFTLISLEGKLRAYVSSWSFLQLLPYSRARHSLLKSTIISVAPTHSPKRVKLLLRGR